MTEKMLFGFPIVENPALNTTETITFTSDNLMQLWGKLHENAVSDDGGFIVPWIFCKQLRAMFALEGRERGTIRAKRRYRARFKAECRRIEAEGVKGRAIL